MKTKIWLISWLIIVASALSAFGFLVYKVDPFFHYHKPELDRYFYPLDNQRSQNDGIIKHFDYDALITGTSMTQNFRTTEADKIFGFSSIKVTFSGGSFKEINDNIEKALSANKRLKTVIRCLDMEKFIAPADNMRTDLGKYPTYLYDNNIFNDVEYLLNRDVIFGRAYKMSLDTVKEDFQPGITTFDDYSRWQDKYTFGIDTVSPKGVKVKEKDQLYLTDEEKDMIKKNIHQNVTSVAEKYPDVDFYYFYSPYSIVAWNNWKIKGSLFKQLEAEAYISELIIPHKNIHLFSFNNRTDITTDLNNYKDRLHYGSWINSLILRWMYDGQYQLTEENYKDYLKKEYDFYTTFDYSSVNGQIDYEADYYAAALLNHELTGVRPLDVLNDSKLEVTINGADYKYDGGHKSVVDCHGSLSRKLKGEELSKYLWKQEFIGIKFNVNLDDGYNYLSFNGQKIADHGRLTAYVFDSDGVIVGEASANYSDLDNEVHQYVIDLSAVDGNVTVVLNGGYIDSTGSDDSEYQFSKIYLY